MIVPFESWLNQCPVPIVNRRFKNNCPEDLFDLRIAIQNANLLYEENVHVVVPLCLLKKILWEANNNIHHD